MAIDRKRLETALAMVRPLILGHGGDIRVSEDPNEVGTLNVELFGACRACPSMAMTFVGPVRTAFLKVDGVKDVTCGQVRSCPKALARLSKLLGAAPIEAA